MGYSCSAIAGLTQDALLKILQENDTESGSNGWKAKGKKLFAERGKENDDGAITGTCFKSLDNGFCRAVGNYRIEGNGTINRWPTTSAKQRQQAQQIAKEIYDQRYNPLIRNLAHASVEYT